MKKGKFFKNATILTISGLVLRALGMVFRVVISSQVGEEGMGVYQLITSAYFLFISVAHFGLAATVTRLCSAKLACLDRSGAEGTVKKALVISFGAGIFACALMFFCAPFVAKSWIADPRAELSLKILAFSLPAIAPASVLSGYFIAKKNVINGCTAGILEQLLRLLFAYLALRAFALKEQGFLIASLFFANTVSELAAFVYLFVCYLKEQKPTQITKQSAKPILSGAIPIFSSKLLSSSLRTLENMLVPTAISMFTKSKKLALSQFGALKGMAIPLLFFPFSLLSAISTLLLPEISDASASGSEARTKRLVQSTCSLTLKISFMFAGAFFINAKDLGQVVYSSRTAGFVIQFLAPLVPFMYLDSMCDGLIKGLGKQTALFVNNCVDSAVRIALTLLLAPRFGLVGFLIVMAVSNIGICCANFNLLIKTTGTKISLVEVWGMPILWVFASAIITKLLPSFSATMLNIILSTAIFCLLYGIFWAVLGYKSKNFKNN